MNMSTNSGMSDGKTSPNISSAKKADIEQRRETLQSQIADAKKEARSFLSLFLVLLLEPEPSFMISPIRIILMRQQRPRRIAGCKTRRR